ncbi:MAG: class I SAM-dependent methyltransferase [Candidatus Poribacteria bacterium]
MEIKTEEQREKLKQFYETSEDYKKLLSAHNREYLKTYVDIVVKYAKPASKILDLGCGNGLSSKMINEFGYNVIGTDISHFFLVDSLKFQNESLSYCVCDVLDLPFCDESFDVVCSNELIEHITDASKSLLEMIRVLKKGGILVIMGPNLCSPFWSLIDLVNIIRGRKGRYVWAETWRQALKWGWKNFVLSIKKRFSRKANFIHREPDIDKAGLGGDSDSAYYASPIDIEKFLKANGMKIVKLCESSSKKGRIMARLFPRFGLYISMVTRKTSYFE